MVERKPERGIGKTLSSPSLHFHARSKAIVVHYNSHIFKKFLFQTAITNFPLLLGPDVSVGILPNCNMTSYEKNFHDVNKVINLGSYIFHVFS